MSIVTANLNDIVSVAQVDTTTGKTWTYLGQIVGINLDGSFQVRGVSGFDTHFVYRRMGFELTATTFRYNQFGIGAKAVPDPTVGTL